jgi:hypothetical protein
VILSLERLCFVTAIRRGVARNPFSVGELVSQNGESGDPFRCETGELQVCLVGSAGRSTLLRRDRDRG